MAVIDFPGQDPDRDHPFPLSVVDVTTTAFLLSLPSQVLQPGSPIRITQIASLLERCRSCGIVEPQTGLRALAGYFVAGGAEAIVLNAGSAPVLSQSVVSRLDPFEDISFLVAPGFSDSESQRRLVAWCHKSQRAMALLDFHDVEPMEDPLGYAAAFGPNILVMDPLSGLVIKTPPAGHVAGSLVRLTAQHGVGRSSNAMLLPEGLGIEEVAGKTIPSNVNELVQRDGVIVVNSDRTLAADGDWQRLATRRLGTLIDRTFSELARHTFDQPNRSVLWSRVGLTADRFMAGLHRNSGLAGATPKDAFRIEVGRETTTEADIAQGRFILRIAFAPTKPAEFVTLDIALPAQPG